MEGEESILVSSPSFNSYSSSNFAEIAAKVTMEFQDQREELGLQESDLIEIIPVEEEEKEKEKETTPEDSESDEDDDDDDDDFEFAVLSRDPNASPISADEIFANGQIKPIYPVFNRDLLFAGGQDDFTDGDTIRLPLRKLMIRDERGEPSSSSSSESDEIEGLPDGTYCVWTPKPAQPSPETCKKSKSTGSSSRRWRFRNLLHRSNSDGKDTFVFLTPNTTKAKPAKQDDKVLNKERRHSSAETDTATATPTTKEVGKAKSKGKSGEGSSSASAHEAHYVRNRAMKEGDRRRSYLPYRQDLVGLFANVNVNGLNRTLRPF